MDKKQNYFHKILTKLKKLILLILFRFQLNVDERECKGDFYNYLLQLPPQLLMTRESLMPL